MSAHAKPRTDPIALITRVAAVAVGATCIAYSTALAGEPRSASFFAGAAAVGIVAAAVTLREWAIGAAVGTIALSYCYGLLQAGDRLDAGAPLVGAGLLLVGELFDLARAGGEGRWTEQDVWGRRAIFLLAIAAGGAALGQFALLVGGSARGTGPLLLFLAAVVAVGALVIVVRLVRSLMETDPTRQESSPEADGAAPPGGR